MAIITYPLNGIEYNAENAETYLCTRTSGVYSAENNFALSITDSMQVTIGAGIAWIKNDDFAGKSIVSTEETVLEISTADATLNRKDRVVIQFDKGLNQTSIILKKGTSSVNAVAPDIIRNGIVYELGLYVIDILAGAVSIQAENITNTMLDESVCGLMRDGVTGIPTNTLQAQAESIIAQIKNALNTAISGGIPSHAYTHSLSGNDPIAPESIGAAEISHIHGNLTNDGKIGNTSGYVVMTGINGTIEAKSKSESGLTLAPIKVSANGEINISIADNTDYDFTSVTSLNISGNNNSAHGFIKFASIVPTILLSGFNAVSGDDIVSDAAANEKWEFSAEKGYIIFKNWGA